MQALPRMEAHVFDAGHKLLETHAAAAVSLMRDSSGAPTAKAPARFNRLP